MEEEESAFSTHGVGTETRSQKSNTGAGAASIGSATRRLASDLRQIMNDAPEGCSASPVNEADLHVWHATITGPDETPWEGGIYTLRLVFPDDYPAKAPRIKFLCEIFHPNVYVSGDICLDIIASMWSPVFTVSSILTSIQSLLTDPNCQSPANTEAARLYEKDPKAYKRRVRQCAERSLETSF